MRSNPHSSARIPPRSPVSGGAPRHRALTATGYALAGVVALLLLAVIAGGLWGWHTLRGSLPITSGTVVLPGVSAPVNVARDALGVPTITGHTRLDVARATGFVHAQERFVQMDLQRRKAAGELAEIIGRAGLTLDQRSRIHRFRVRARRVVAAATAQDRALLGAYTEGVNAGLAALHRHPFEYVLLGVEPTPWRMEDSILVVFSMYMELQDERGREDLRRGLMLEHLPPPLAEFILSLGSVWDTPLVGSPLDPPEIPDAQVFDLRTAGRSAAPGVVATHSTHPEPRRPGSQGNRSQAQTDSFYSWLAEPEPDLVPGSNGWAIAGAHTASGSALLASDMHLGLSVPNFWFRVVLAWGGGTPEGPARIVGVTLPGLPSLVAGSNGQVAWGFTNAEVDATDLVVLEPDPAEPARYLTPDGPRAYEKHRERIAVKDESDALIEVRETLWGPVVAERPDGRSEAVRWVAHEVEAVNLRLHEMERAETLREALYITQRAGIPAQNCVIADKSGAIGWTIAGRLPRRVGLDGRVPASWADGSRGWHGWLAPSEYPQVINPPSGRIVTANNRLVDGEALRRLGQGAFDQGARARQIRDQLMLLERATPRDMLKVQLDDRALFLARWRELALEVLTPTAVDGAPLRQEFRTLLERTWTGRATPDSVAYRLVKTFREKAAELAFAPIIAPARGADTRFPARPGRAMEGALWRLVKDRPGHLLDPAYPSWEALLLAAIDSTAQALSADGRSLGARTWGEVNTLAMRHPLSRALPWLSPMLDMEAQPLPGDVHMPRVQGARFGASERLVVSPGRENEGLFHMPGGQSGHPLSPAYRAGHAAWAEGQATPLLPGPTMTNLELVPAGS